MSFVSRSLHAPLKFSTFSKLRKYENKYQTKICDLTVLVIVAELQSQNCISHIPVSVDIGRGSTGTLAMNQDVNVDCLWWIYREHMFMYTCECVSLPNLGEGWSQSKPITFGNELRTYDIIPNG